MPFASNSQPSCRSQRISEMMDLEIKRIEGLETSRLRPLVVKGALQEVQLQRARVETQSIAPRRHGAQQPPPHRRESQIGDRRVVGVQHALEIADAAANAA